MEIDVHKPLCRGQTGRFSPNREGWLSFRYERLPIFCHWCGILNHDSKECDLWLQSKGELSTEDQEYGSWLRADPPSLRRKKVVRVCGIGAPKVASGREREAREANIELTSHADVQQGEQRVFETNLEAKCGMGEITPIVVELSKILRNEDASQNHLEEIDMELEGHTNTVKGTTESNFSKVGGAKIQGKAIIMVEESILVDTNSDVVGSSPQTEVDLTRIIPNKKKEEGHLVSQTCWEGKDRQRT